MLLPNTPHQLLRWLLMLLLVMPFAAQSQTLMGDTPCDAPVVTPTFGCPANSAANEYTSDATFTDFLGGATCNGVEKPIDAWVMFTATTNSAAITWTEVGVRNSVLYFYAETAAGACPGLQPTLTNIACKNASPGGVGETEFYELATTPGTNYYIRVKRIVDVNDLTQDGFLCVAACSMTANQQIVQAASCKDVCDGVASVTPFNGAQPITYLWPAVTGFQSDSTVSGLCDGVYTVTITDQGGCSLTKNVTMTEPQAFQISVDSVQVSCHHGDNGLAIVTASGGTLPYTYLWDANAGSQMTSTATGLIAGTYGVTVSDGGTCTASGSTTVWEPDTILYDYAVTNASCPGTSTGSIKFFNIDGGNTSLIFSDDSGYTYQADSNFFFLPAATYWMVAIDSFGCGDTLPIVVGEPDSIHFTAIPLHLTCATVCDGSIALIPNGGNPPYTYHWSNFASGNTVQNLCAGTYGVTVTDALGCTNDTTVTLTQPDLIQLTSLTVTNTCFGGNDGVAQVFTQGGVPPFTFNWTGSASNADSIWNLAAGTYSVTATDDNGCSESKSMVVSQPLPISVMPTATPDTLCIGEQTTLNVSATGGNGSPYSYLWNGNNSMQSFTETLTASVPYSVQVFDANGCASNTAVISVYVWPPINGTAIATSTTLCEEQNTTFMASATGGNGGPYDMTFDGNTWVGFQTQQIVQPTSYPDPTTYDVLFEDGCNPPDMVQITINYHISPVVGVTYSESFGCEPFTTTITNTSSPILSLVTWNPGDGNLQTNTNQDLIYTYNEPGLYWPELTVIHAGTNCQVTKTVAQPIEVHPNPIARFRSTPQPTTVIDTELQFTDLSEGDIYLWQWQFFDNDLASLLGASVNQSPSREYPAVAGEYPVKLTVTTIHGCQDFEYKRIKIDEDHTLWLPNAFTPNGDGENDTFYPSGVGISDDRYAFEIYNRFGSRIYRTTNRDDQWDGLENGNPLPTGVYVWRLVYRDVTDANDNERQEMGYVTLIR